MIGRPLLVSLVPFWMIACASGGPQAVAADAGSVTPGDGSDPVDQSVLVRMRDGVALNTHLFFPKSISRDGLPTVVLRTPYRFPGSGDDYYRQSAAFHASRGYAFVLQDCRGRFGSEGTFVPFQNEIEDGADTVEWIAKQSWSNGRVGTIGGSYNGYTAIAAAIGSRRVQVVVADDPAEDLGYNRLGSAIAIFPLSWLYLLDHGGWPPAGTIEESSNWLDLATLDSHILGRKEPFWSKYLNATGPDDPVFQLGSLRGHYGHTCAALLTVKSRTQSWEDPVRVWRGFIDDGCAERRSDHRLVVTDEDHTYHLTALGTKETPVNHLMLDYLDAWLCDERQKLDGVPAVQFIAPGETSFHAATRWPAADTELVLYLDNPQGVTAKPLLSESPPQAARTDMLQFRPAQMDPCGQGYPNLSYVSAELKHSVYLAGAPRAELNLRATAPQADLSVLLYEYNAADKPPLQFVASGATRAKLSGAMPGSAASTTVQMHSLTHTFRAGSRIAIVVTGSLCGYAENPNSGEPPDAQTSWRESTYGLCLGGDGPRSRLVLPVLAE